MNDCLSEVLLEEEVHSEWTLVYPEVKGPTPFDTRLVRVNVLLLTFY